MTTIASNLQAAHERIARAAARAGRPISEITLLAVSKTCPASYIEEAASAGQKAFGESYAQEAVKKITALASRDLEWHFIGPLQSNKTRVVANHFQWVHSVEREKTAVRLNDALAEHLPRLNVCIEVNLSGEGSKSGVVPGEEVRLAELIANLPRLRLRGLMAIPEPTQDEIVQRRQYALLHRLREGLRKRGHDLDTLSMGMSGDLEAAIAEGATIVRVGTAIFGRRETL